MQRPWWAFAEVVHGDVTITDASREFATAGVYRSHEIFNENPLTGCNSSVSHSPTAV